VTGAAAVHRSLAVGLLLLLAGCGLKGDLKPVPPQGPPPTPRGETGSPASADMLERAPQAAPLRVDDPVKKSEERPEDRFNLPPPRTAKPKPATAPTDTAPAAPEPPK
jgi:predicted small lipoprotein YifL